MPAAKNKRRITMKNITTLILTTLTSTLLSEELSSMSQEEIDAIPYNVSAISIPSLVRRSEVAGIGTFANVQSSASRFVDISVLEWWTDKPGTNDMLRIHDIEETSSSWAFPTNTLVVFFANATSNAILSTCLGADMVSRMNQEEKEQWMFKHADRSWFRVSRDEGLMHSFATNLWQHARVSPNITNQYEIFRDAYRSACDNILSEQPLPSWRVAYDSIEGLDYIERVASENFLATIMTDPLLPELAQTGAINALGKRFCWSFDTNGVLRAPDTAVLFSASSNFTAQALAAWRTHDTNSIISFAQDALAANPTPEAMLFRGAAAYYLESDFDAATNLVLSANQLVIEHNLYTPKQKKTFSSMVNFFTALDPDFTPIMLKVLGRREYVEGRYLEEFWEEHSSDAGIFEKFGGEFPFGKTLIYMYDRE
jgi:hypothetical protein